MKTGVHFLRTHCKSWVWSWTPVTLCWRGQRQEHGWTFLYTSLAPGSMKKPFSRKQSREGSSRTSNILFWILHTMHAHSCIHNTKTQRGELEQRILFFSVMGGMRNDCHWLLHLNTCDPVRATLWRGGAGLKVCWLTVPSSSVLLLYACGWEFNLPVYHSGHLSPCFCFTIASSSVISITLAEKLMSVQPNSNHQTNHIINKASLATHRPFTTLIIFSCPIKQTVC